MILIISDYHKQEDKVLNLIDLYKPQYILCLGDGESDEAFYQKYNIISVRGNCDFNNLPLVEKIEILGKRFILTHGHLYDVHFDVYKLYLLAKQNDAEIVCFGHTHQSYFEEYDGVKIVNPGALKDGNYALFDGKEFIFK